MFYLAILLGIILGAVFGLFLIWLHKKISVYAYQRNHVYENHCYVIVGDTMQEIECPK